MEWLYFRANSKVIDRDGHPGPFRWVHRHEGKRTVAQDALEVTLILSLAFAISDLNVQTMNSLVDARLILTNTG